MRFPAEVPVLGDGHVALRPHREDDVPRILEQCTDEATVRWTSIHSPYSLDDAKRYVRHLAPAGWDSETEFPFAIEEGGRYAGSCSLRVLSDRRGDVGYVVHPDTRGRGVVERALRLLVEWAFTARQMESLSWWAHAGNWASRRVAWKLGFSCHGPLEHWLPQRGTLHDGWFGVLLRDQPRSPRHEWHVAPRVMGEHVVLRPHRDDDIPRVVEACRDQRTRQWTEVPSPYTPDSARDWLESRTDLMATGKGVHWTVADPRTDLLLAAVTLFDIRDGRDAEVGYWAHPEARGRGVVTEACRLAVRHAFIPTDDGGLGLGRVTAYAGVDNAASLHVIETVGFRRYGVERRGGSNAEGDVFDLACYDLLAEEIG